MNQDETNSARGFTRLEDPISAVDKDRWGRDVKVQVQGWRIEGRLGWMDEISLEETNESHRGIRVGNEITITSEGCNYKDRLY